MLCNETEFLSVTHNRCHTPERDKYDMHWNRKKPCYILQIKYPKGGQICYIWQNIWQKPNFQYLPSGISYIVTLMFLLYPRKHIPEGENMLCTNRTSFCYIPRVYTPEGDSYKWTEIFYYSQTFKNKHPWNILELERAKNIWPKSNINYNPHQSVECAGIDFFFKFLAGPSETHMQVWIGQGRLAL